MKQIDKQQLFLLWLLRHLSSTAVLHSSRKKFSIMSRNEYNFSSHDPSSHRTAPMNEQQGMHPGADAHTESIDAKIEKARRNVETRVMDLEDEIMKLKNLVADMDEKIETAVTKMDKKIETVLIALGLAHETSEQDDTNEREGPMET